MLFALVMLTSLAQATQHIPETLTIKKTTALETTAIAVLDTDTDTVAATMNEQLALLADLYNRSGFQSGVLFKSQDSRHVILYTQWKSADSLQAVLMAGAAASQLRPFAVSYLASPGGGDSLVPSKPRIAGSADQCHFYRS